jgi:hypothetical protein
MKYMKLSKYIQRLHMALLSMACVVAISTPTNSFGQTVIGSWQNNSGDGWIDWGNQLSVTNAANVSKYSFVSSAVSGYGQSLQISQSGYNQNLAIKLQDIPGGVAAFLANKQMSFTLSVPSAASSGSTAGYCQLYGVAINASGYGFNDQGTNQFSATGDVANNNGWQPNFFFYAGAPARSQVVTLNYSNILSSITATPSSGFIEIIFSFNNGGGSPANFFMNNVVLSGGGSSTNNAQLLTYVVDNFAPAGVSSSNPSNFNYYQSNYVYSSGQITNVYGNWFGGAFQSLAWDSTADASNNINSGALKINANFSPANNQFLVWNQGSPNNFFALNIDGMVYTNFQCDVRFAPGSASDSGSYGSPIFGHLRFGDRTSTYSQDWFGAVDVSATNTNWVHVSIPLDAISNPNLTNILGLIIGIDRNFYSLNLNGSSTLWVDNIKFTGSVATTTNAAPSLNIQKATPGLRIFAGATGETFYREQLATVDQNQSWIGGTYPVTYSFTLRSSANYNGFQTHLFLVPITSALPNQPYNQYVEYQASNNLWLQINGNTNGTVTANVSWKTNTPNANPNQVAINITNATAVGTWTLRFTSPSGGTLTAPGASPVAFTIPDPNVATHFANPVVAYFGLQPNSTAGIGAYVDYAQISVTGVAGNSISDDFTTDTSIGSQWDVSASQQPSSLILVTTNSTYWVNWTLPDNGYGLGVAPNVTGGQWKLPEYYNFYNDGLNLPVLGQQGFRRWALVPTSTLPTVDASQGGILSPNGFYRLFNPSLTP